MPTFTLTDVSHEIWVETLTVDAAEMGLAVTSPWSVAKRRLHGGRRDGVDLIIVDNGVLRFAIVPTRGMGLWKGFHEGNVLGWESPIADGPVHPALVNLTAAGGLGWLDGFDELMARCGLENNGAPFEIKGAQRRWLGEPGVLRPARPDREHPRLVRGGARRPGARRTRSASRGMSTRPGSSARSSAWRPDIRRSPARTG